MIDIQEAFRGRIDTFEEIASRAAFLIRVARLLDIPIAACEQNPDRLGPLTTDVAAALADIHPIAKMTFNAIATPAFAAALDTRRDQALVIGIEAHVCVLQTALNLLTTHRNVFVAIDATGSQRRPDAGAAIDRLVAAGAVPVTAESAAFELVATAAAPEFRDVLALVKAEQQHDQR